MAMSPGKIKHMKALSNKDGIIAAAAMDQRGSLQKSIAKAKGVEESAVTPAMMSEFKTAVVRILTPYASAILLDPEFGLEASKSRAPNAGLLLAYEESGYDNTKKGRLPDLLPNVSVRQLLEWGANAVKILLYYSPFDEPKFNNFKMAFIERIGAECEFHEVPFFLEFVGYDPEGKISEKSLEFAKIKPQVVMGAMREFSKEKYYVDVLKVEVPVNAVYVEGSSVYGGQKAYSRAEALHYYREAADIATKPFIYLSAGVSNDQFAENLAMAAESGTDYSGVLCGRATWADGMEIYGKKGLHALEDWLSTEGVKNIKHVNSALGGATPWMKKAGVAAA
jgi:tagatose 1,6-diphosphate aldolase